MHRLARRLLAAHATRTQKDGRSRAFTLIELIVAIVVLGLLAALAVPALNAVVDRSHDEAARIELLALHREAAALAALDSGMISTSELSDAAADTGAAQAAGTLAQEATSKLALTIDDTTGDPTPNLPSEGYGQVSFATDAGGNVELAMVSRAGNCALLAGGATDAVAAVNRDVDVETGGCVADLEDELTPDGTGGDGGDDTSDGGGETLDQEDTTNVDESEPTSPVEGGTADEPVFTLPTEPTDPQPFPMSDVVTTGRLADGGTSLLVADRDGARVHVIADPASGSGYPVRTVDGVGAIADLTRGMAPDASVDGTTYSLDAVFAVTAAGDLLVLDADGNTVATVMGGFDDPTAVLTYDPIDAATTERHWRALVADADGLHLVDTLGGTIVASDTSLAGAADVDYAGDGGATSASAADIWVATGSSVQQLNVDFLDGTIGSATAVSGLPGGIVELSQTVWGDYHAVPDALDEFAAGATTAVVGGFANITGIRGGIHDSTGHEWVVDHSTGCLSRVAVGDGTHAVTEVFCGAEPPNTDLEVTTVGSTAAPGPFTTDPYGQLWHLSGTDLHRIDPTTGNSVEQVTHGISASNFSYVAVGSDTAWIVGQNRSTAWSVDLTTGTSTQEYSTSDWQLGGLAVHPDGTAHLVSRYGNLWAWDGGGFSDTGIDVPSTAAIAFAGNGLLWSQASYDLTWTNLETGTSGRFDNVSRSGSGAVGVLDDGRVAYVAGSSTVGLLDPATRHVQVAAGGADGQVDGRGPSAGFGGIGASHLAVTGDTVWFHDQGTLRRGDVVDNAPAPADQADHTTTIAHDTSKLVTVVPDAGVAYLAAGPDTSTVFGGGADTVRRVDLAAGTSTVIASGLEGSVSDIAYDGHLIYVVHGEQNRLSVVRPETGDVTLLASDSYSWRYRSLAIDPDGEVLVGYSTYGVRRWDPLYQSLYRYSEAYDDMGGLFDMQSDGRRLYATKANVGVIASAPGGTWETVVDPDLLESSSSRHSIALTGDRVHITTGYNSYPATATGATSVVRARQGSTDPVVNEIGSAVAGDRDGTSTDALLQSSGGRSRMIGHAGRLLIVSHGDVKEIVASAEPGSRVPDGFLTTVTADSSSTWQQVHSAVGPKVVVDGDDVYYNANPDTIRRTSLSDPTVDEVAAVLPDAGTGGINALTFDGHMLYAVGREQNRLWGAHPDTGDAAVLKYSSYSWRFRTATVAPGGGIAYDAYNGWQHFHPANYRGPEDNYSIGDRRGATADGRYVWLRDEYQATVERIDTSTSIHESWADYGTGANHGGPIVSAGDWLYMRDGDVASSLQRVDKADPTATPVSVHDFGANITDLWADGGYVYAVAGGALYRTNGS